MLYRFCAAFFSPFNSGYFIFICTMEDVFLQTDLKRINKDLWDLLNKAVGSFRAPFHQAFIATINGILPEVRTVVLRRVLTEEKQLFFHTDIRSPKVAQIREHPEISWLFYDPELRIQLRCYGLSSVHQQDALAEWGWEHSRLSSRLCYTNQEPPGSIVEKPELIDLNRKQVSDDELENARQHFSVICFRVYRMDWLYLHHTGHRRAEFDYRSNHFRWKQV